ncbi:CubicO group peptidase (beta-lactamase class C family) [Catenuloplanes nepalensis]|uniref:CubicO group peptidase (Beta-lactamase class C family) n=1 Tax=Catenuloplanes nepalensis TaxID=587533 RepID=A0ABT9N889_9ACTN|nr:serine hydrolase domain-containing protein [Catenuloplanes nepalensis]MDP9799915.1 CubicO group peptidase (beta-lactamase class C family) [Catenuloplanes nepalensis]
MADLLPDTRRALRHRLAAGQSRGRTPSVVAAVVRDGGPVWAEGWGTVDGGVPDGDVQYRIGSITKTFTAILVLRLRDEGLLDLGDVLDAHLPGTAAGDATIGALLAHTAGLAAEPPGPWWERTPGALRPELTDVLPATPFVSAPGRRFHYSNPGYALLGALVEKLRGASWAEVLRREVLEPLGMRRTGLDPVAPHAAGWAVHPWADVLLPEPAQDLGVMAPAGALWSTASDLARLAAFLLDGDDRVLRRDTVEEMCEPRTPEYGLGVQILRAPDGRVLTGHTGSLPGFLAMLAIDPEERLGAVVFGNATTGLDVGAVTADLIRIVAEREPHVPEPWRPLPSIDPELLALAGPWYWGPSPYLLSPAADGFLELSALHGGGTRATRLRPDPDGGWTGRSGYFAGERLRVERDASGAVTHLDVGTFVFTRRPYDPGAPIPGGVDRDGWRV